jgi:hypothetical protein
LGVLWDMTTLSGSAIGVTADVRNDLPVAFAFTTLLGASRVGIRVSSLGKVARQPRLTFGSAISNAGVVTVSELVRASHYQGSSAYAHERY